ncbi:hypothetical protein HJC23_010054 [Cyclotella cryptica]|uniref:Uncharacterized protein n=1 Tax=Cyclotella cryptica TaxID=29204 RepID=A0ABD3NZL5_9STRA
MRFPSAINSIVKSLCPTPLFLAGTGKSASYSGSRRECTPPPSARRIPTRNRPSSRASNYANGNDDSRPVVAGTNLVLGHSERDSAGAVPPIAVTVPVGQSLPESEVTNPFEDSQETHVRRLMFLARNSLLFPLLSPVALVPLTLPGHLIPVLIIRPPRKLDPMTRFQAVAAVKRVYPKTLLAV